MNSIPRQNPEPFQYQREVQGKKKVGPKNTKTCHETPEGDWHLPISPVDRSDLHLLAVAHSATKPRYHFWLDLDDQWWLMQLRTSKLEATEPLSIAKPIISGRPNVMENWPYAACDSAPSTIPKPPSKFWHRPRYSAASDWLSRSRDRRSASPAMAQYENRVSDSPQQSPEKDPFCWSNRARMSFHFTQPRPNWAWVYLMSNGSQW